MTEICQTKRRVENRGKLENGNIRINEERGNQVWTRETQTKYILTQSDS